MSASVTLLGARTSLFGASVPPLSACILLLGASISMAGASVPLIHASVPLLGECASSGVSVPLLGANVSLLGSILPTGCRMLVYPYYMLVYPCWVLVCIPDASLTLLGASGSLSVLGLVNPISFCSTWFHVSIITLFSFQIG